MGFGWTDVAFGLVVRRWHEQVVSKTQHVVLTVAQHFQQDAAEGLGDGLGRSGRRRTCDRPTRTPWRKLLSHIALVPASMASLLCRRARLAAWISPRSAVWIWVGQAASG